MSGVQDTTRRAFLGACALTQAPAAAPAPQPNILWLIAEDFSPDLGCYGNTLVRTPNLDKLAAQGMRFANAFVTAPVCSASRSAIATGMYQTTIGAHHHRSHREDGYRPGGGVRVFTSYLREAGYYTVNVENERGLQGTGKTDFNFDCDKPFDGDEWTGRKAGRPFYAQLNFQETHRPFRADPARPVDVSKIKLPACYPDHPAIRFDWAMYLESAQRMDAKVGRALQRLAADGLAADTIVVFFGDHGQPMPRGKQFLYDAGIRIPLIVYVPEKFRVPGYAPGKVVEGLVSSIDITATTLHLAGVPVPRHMQARPFLGAGAKTRDAIFAARDRCDETVDRIRCVRDARFKYIRNFYPERAYTQQNVYKDRAYPPLRVMRDLNERGKLTGAAAAFLAPSRPAEELYDLAADPDETRNLAADPAQASRLAGMRKSLSDWVRETHDAGEVPEADIPESEKLACEVDGWLSGSARMERRAGVLKIEFIGEDRGGLRRTIVTEKGQFLLECRARSGDVRFTSAMWGLIENMRNPALKVKCDATPDGDWTIYRARFETPSWLGFAGLLPDKSGTIEIDWIRLSRIQGGKTALVQDWSFQ